MNDKVGRKEEMTKRRDGRSDRKGEMAELAGMAEMTSMAKFVGSEGCPGRM